MVQSYTAVMQWIVKDIPNLTIKISSFLNNAQLASIPPTSTDTFVSETYIGGGFGTG